jgi:hypothetical protein
MIDWEDVFFCIIFVVIRICLGICALWLIWWMLTPASLTRFLIVGGIFGCLWGLRGPEE